MTPLIVLAVQCTFSLIVFYILSKWYLITRISKNNQYEILAILLIVNVFRYLPLSLYMPGQVSPDFPEYVKEIVTHGDFISSVLAFISLLLLKSKNKLAIPFVWIFSIASVLDMILALYFAMSEKVYDLPLGVNYFTVAVYVPMLMVAQVIIFKLLVTKNQR